MSIPQVRSDELSSTGLTDTGRSTNQQILGLGSNLAVKGQFRIDLFSSSSLQEINRRVIFLTELVMISLHAIGILSEPSSMRLKLREFLRGEGVISYDDLTAGEV